MLKDLHCVVPDRPIITTITPNVTSLLVSWTNEGPSITGYYVYLDSQRIHTEIRGTRVNITGLAPFTNYTVEVSAFNTRGDGTEQEGPRSDPRTETTLGECTYT